MRPEPIAWERAAEVHEAARGWRRAGAIDQATERTICDAFPDPCVTPTVVWRVVTALMVAAVILCTFGAVSLAIGGGESALHVLLLLFGGACLVATDVTDATPRLARRGAAGATSVLGVGFFLVGFGLLLTDTFRMGIDDTIDAVLVAGALTGGLTCWRWGSPLFAALATVSLVLYLGRLPQGRLLWLLAGLALAGLAGRRLDAPSWAPSHRLAAAVLVVAGLVAAYAAVNVYSLDERLLENLARYGASRDPASPRLRVLSALATAAFPVAVLAWGARSRRAFVLDTGIVLLALSLLTLRHYVHLAPLWAILTLSGATLVVLALAVERRLRRAPGQEISGFTADPLFSDERRQRGLQIVPVVAAFTPTATPPAAPGKEFTGGGGKFGGGGAGEKL
jgi:hypothetical protein